MKVAVIGANGQLGVDVSRSFLRNNDEVVELTHPIIEITNIDSVAAVLRQLKPQVIVNAAAMHHVEKCEQDPQAAFNVNAIGPRNLAILCQEIKACLIHISTDYVFDGSKTEPYIEADRPLPINVYGNTKLAGEHFLQSISGRYFILRTSCLYGKNPCRGKNTHNFVELIRKLSKERNEIRVVDDEFITPTSTSELARQIVKVSGSDAYGLYHATAEGSCSWHEFARNILSLIESRTKLEVAAPGEFPAKVPRPKYSALENCCLKKSGLNVFKHWSGALTEYLTRDN
jgi:dTDP-4-dehydrorhamnose reductase